MNFGEKVKNVFNKAGKFVIDHKATFVSILGPAVLTYIAKEWGLDYSVTKNPAPKLPTPREVLDKMYYESGDPTSMAILSLMKSGEGIWSDSGKLGTVKRIYNLVADVDNLSETNKTLAIQAIESINRKIWSDSYKHAANDYIASVAAIKIPQKAEESVAEEEKAGTES